MIENKTKRGENFRHSLKIEEISTDFELNWNSVRRKEIEHYIAASPAGLTTDIVRELVTIECELRTHAGETPQSKEYLARFPDNQDEVGEAFEILDQLKLESTFKQSATPESELPKYIGDYRIVRKIGQGGMGIVYEAVQESLDRKVAI